MKKYTFNTDTNLDGEFYICDLCGKDISYENKNRGYKRKNKVIFSLPDIPGLFETNYFGFHAHPECFKELIEPLFLERIIEQGSHVGLKRGEEVVREFRRGIYIDNEIVEEFELREQAEQQEESIIRRLTIESGCSE